MQEVLLLNGISSGSAPLVPPTVLIHRDRTNVHAGPDTNVTITCLVEGVPKPTISWTA